MRFSPQRRAIFRHRNYKSASELRCFVHFDVKMCFAPKRRAIFDFSSDHMTPHSPLQGAYFSTHPTRIIEKALHFPTSLTFGACESSFFWLSRYCIFFLLTLLDLICFSSAFQLSILSELYYLNFLRPSDSSRDHFVPDSQRSPTTFKGVTFSPSPKKNNVLQNLPGTW